MDLDSGSESSLTALLRQKKDPLLNDWFRRITDSYPGETASFLRQRQDRFANPAAYAFRAAIEAVCRALIENSDVDCNPLEYAIKIKALQGSDPAEGVAFIRRFKDTVREKLSVPEHQLKDLDARIDEIASIAEDMFLANRRKIAELNDKLE